ncbi:MAG: hypothetical protein OER96_03400, partial [Gammaproteobacteria bacterium]|nr:hypothetical protein [Gammaproteobacteria bacterium]
NFEEFVFVPTTEDRGFEGTDFVQSMRYYYFYEPAKQHRVNAWKNLGQIVDLKASGGHSVSFDGRSVAPVNFVLRHYVLLSREHAIRKYGKRKYSKAEIDLGLHQRRAAFDSANFCLPNRTELKCIDFDGEWDCSEPWVSHPFL